MSLLSAGSALDDRHVDLLHLAFAQHAVQFDQGAALLRDDQQAGGVAVEPMRQFQQLGLRARRAQRFDDAEADAAAAVDRDAGGLVDHQQ